MRAIIDGTAIAFDGEVSIRAGAKRLGIEIPTPCFDPRVEPNGVCRICCVEVEGEVHPQIACRTMLRDGMRVTTRSAALDAFRQEMLTLMAAHIRADAFADQPDKEFHRLMRACGVAPGQKGRRPIRIDASHPYIRVDMSQCIECMRCVRICADLEGQFVWHVLDRGEDMRVVPDSGTTLRASTCVGCGACSDTCPTGALTDKLHAAEGRVDGTTRTLCA